MATELPPIRLAESGALGCCAGTAERWELVLPYRHRLLALAYRRGAGADAEDLVHDCLLAAARYQWLDPRRPWPFLATVLLRRLIDHYRRAARERALRAHRAIHPRPGSFESDILDQLEAIRVASQLRQRVAPDVVQVVHELAAGATLPELAAARGVSASALQSRVWRALRRFRGDLKA